MPLYSAFCTLDDLSTNDPAMLAQEIRRLESQGIVTGMDPNRFLGKANSFILPRGFEAGRGWVLLTGAKASTLNQNIATHTLRFKGGGDISFKKLSVVGCEALTGTEVYSDTSLYLVELADLRHFGQYTSINKAYNLLVPDESDVYDATQNSGSDWTYTTMVEDIWTFMPGAFGALDVSAVDFSGTPRNYVFRGVTAWDALKKVLDDQQHELILDTEGAFSVVPAFTATGDFDTDRDTHKAFILSGSHDLDTPFSRVPATIRVFFPRRDKAWQNNTDLKVVVYKDHWQLNPLYSVDVAASSIDGTLSTLAGTVLPVHSPEPALYSELGVISNAATLSTQATNIATRVVNARKIADENALYRYSGARAFTLGAEVSCYSVQDTGNGVITEARGYIRSRRSSSRLDRQPLTSGTDLSFFSRESNSPPNIPRWAMETERWVVAKIYGGDLVAGGSQTARVLFGTNGGTITWAETGSAHEITLHEAGGVTIPEDTQVFAIFHQQTERWITFGHEGSPGTIVRFKLTQDLDTGSSATAVIRYWDGAAYQDGAAITVFDWWAISQGGRGMWQAVTNMEGWAVLRENETTEYDIVWMEQYARFIRFTLTEDMGETTPQEASANVNDSWDQGVEPPTTITVHDPLDLFKDCVADCVGIAVRSEYADPTNPTEPYYIVVTCQRAAKLYHGLLSGDMCGGSPSVTDWEMEPVGEFTFDEEPQTVQNSAEHRGQSGDYVAVRRITNERPFLWEIYDVLLKEQQVVTEVVWDDATKCLKKKTRVIAIEACEDESEFENILCFEECP